MKDIVIGLSLAGLGSWIFFTARGFPKLPGKPGPGLFPQILALFLIMASLLLVFLGWRRQRAFRFTFSWQTILSLSKHRAVWNFLAVVMGTIAYVLLSNHIGFFLSASGVLFVLIIQLRTRPLVAFIVAVLVAAGSRLLFQGLLKIPLPPGPLPGGW